MKIEHHPRKVPTHALLIGLMLVAIAPCATAMTADEAAKALPDKIDVFRARGPAQMPPMGIFEAVTPDEFGAISHASRRYEDGQSAWFDIELVKTNSESGAYSLLTRLRSSSENISLGGVGTAGIISANQVEFYKGANFVRIWGDERTNSNHEQLLRLARSFAESLSSEDNDLPVLVKHLPNWQAMVNRADYLMSLESLKSIVPNQQTLLDSISFEGDTEAVAAYYGPAQLVIVEFNTPQLAGDNDRRVAAKIQELRGAGQPVPSAYRRVGNYSVFVFNAADGKTANELIDQVKYEKVVHWLGDNPHWYEKALRQWTQTSAGVLVAVLESSGLALILCLSIGGAIGTLLFRRRRALQRQAALYSDAGGLVRLNLDEITGASDSARLLTKGKARFTSGKKKRDPN